MNNIEVRVITDYVNICNLMKRYGSEYSQEDFNMFLEMDKKCYGFFIDDKILAFGCVVIYEGIDIMTYTWNDGTWSGKKAYSFGHDYIKNIHRNIVYGDGAKKLNKVRRILNEK